LQKNDHPEIERGNLALLLLHLCWVDLSVAQKQMCQINGRGW